MRSNSLLLAVCLILSTAIPAIADEVIELLPFDTMERSALFGLDPVQQSYILVTAGTSPPSICYVLSPGGGGTLFVADRQLGINSVNFLVRSRHLLAGAAQLGTGIKKAKQGSCVAVLDAATDFLFRTQFVDGGGLRGFRRSDERMFDIEAVIKDLQGPPPRFGSELKIVLVGTSRGTIDMAAFAAAVGADQVDVDVDALVLTSSLTTGSTGSPDNVFNVGLDQVRVPTALIFHKDDACSVSPPEDVRRLKAELVNAPRIRVRGFKGGFPPVYGNPSDPFRDCQATTFHGFLGIEAKVVRAITRWVSQVLR